MLRFYIRVRLRGSVLLPSAICYVLCTGIPGRELMMSPIAGLQEVNSLMRDLQRYVEESRRLSTTGPDQHLPVHSSIIEISRQFADDMICLHELLPYDLTKFSTSLRKRTRFVLRAKDTEKVLQRLESRKSAATLALEVIGR